MQRDNVKSRILRSDGSYEKKPQEGERVCAQELLMHQAEEHAREAARHADVPSESFWQRLWRRLAGHTEGR